MVAPALALALAAVLLQDSKPASAPAPPPLPEEIRLGDSLEIPLDRIGEAGVLLRFDLSVAEPITIFAESYDADVSVAIEDASGNVLASDDDSGTETNAYVAWSHAAVGTHRIRLVAKPPREGSAMLRLFRGPSTRDVAEPAEASTAFWTSAFVRSEARGDAARRIEASARLRKEWNLESQEALEALCDPMREWLRAMGVEHDAIHEAERTGDTRTAADAVVRAHALFRARPGDRWDSAMSRLYHELEWHARQAGILDAAGAFAESALAVRERTLPEDHPDLLRSRLQLAMTVRELGDLPRALALDRSVVAAYERTLPTDHPALLDARQNLALSLKDQGDLPRARALEEGVLAALERALPEDHPRILDARQNLAGTVLEQGDLPRARTLFEGLLEARERTHSRDHPDVVAARENFAATAWKQRDFPRARALYEEVLSVRERSLPEGHPLLLDARLGVAAILQEQGDLARARALKESVLAAWERSLPADHPAILRARGNLAVTVLKQGDLAGARLLQESVLAAYERALPEDHLALVGARQNLAATVREQGDLARARVLQESVLAACERTLPEDHPELLDARRSLAATVGLQGDLSREREIEEGVLAAYERTLPEDHPDLLDARHNLASTLWAQGDVARARELEASVLIAFERTLPAGHYKLLGSRHNLAGMLAALGDSDALTEVLKDTSPGCLQSIRIARTLAPREQQEIFASQALLLSAALSWARYVEGTSNLGSALFDWIETRRAASTTEGATGSQWADASLDALRAAVRAARARSADLVSGLGAETAEARPSAEAIAEAARARDDAERALARALAERGMAPIDIDAERLAATLSTGEAAIGFLRYDRQELDEVERHATNTTASMLAHVVLADGSLHRVEMGPLAPIEEAVTRWRAALDAPVARGVGGIAADANAARALGERLRALVLDPVLAAAPEASRLHLALEGALHLAPLEALPLGDGVVGDRVAIRHEVSFARLLRARRAVDEEPRLLALGGVDFDAEGTGIDSDASTPRVALARSGPGGQLFAPLRQTRYEVEAIEDLFERAWKDGTRQVLTKEEATKAAFAEAAPSARWIHVATHGYFSDADVKVLGEPDRSQERSLWRRMSLEETVKGLSPYTLCGLALAGANRGRDSLGRVPGILTAEELMGLDLRNCELAVLSACETHVGLDRGASGIASLQAALHAAGVRTAITSLWKVDDERTRELMTDLYRRLWIGKEPAAVALWNAKKAARAKGWPLKDWSGWILTGDPGDDPERAPASRPASAPAPPR